MSDLAERLRADLTAAMRARNPEAVRALRTAQSAIAKAEARSDPDQTPTSERSGGRIAGATQGLAATEAARRELDEHERHVIVTAERAVRLAAADELHSRGLHERAEALRSEAALLEDYLR